jgi:hypothetical protein
MSVTGTVWTRPATAVPLPTLPLRGRENLWNHSFYSLPRWGRDGVGVLARDDEHCQ